MTRSPFPTPARTSSSEAATVRSADRSTAPDDRAMMVFFERWYAHGGGAGEDILAEFGLPATAFFERISTLLAEPGTTKDTAVRSAMLAVCRKRIWLGR